MTSSLRVLDVGSKRLALPQFLPDATRGVVRCVDSQDLESAGIEAVCMNAFHLSRAPGIEVVERQGGIQRFAAIDLPVFTDSGGFQVLSLAEQPEWTVSIQNKGIRWKRRGEKDDRLLTPTKSLEHQFRLGADAMVALDHCAHPSAPREAHETSVRHTLRWAEEAMEAWRRCVDRSGRTPLLFGVVQGGPHADLRRQCFERLVELGYRAFGFGGWPLGEDGALVDAVFEVAALVPADAPLWGLGIGRPESLTACAAAGYGIFDCTLPTRDARRGRAFRHDPQSGAVSYVYVDDEKHRRTAGPIDPTCGAVCCRRYELGFLRHLREVEEPLADRLLTIHNLRFLSRWLTAIRAARTEVDGPATGESSAAGALEERSAGP